MQSSSVSLDQKPSLQLWVMLFFSTIIYFFVLFQRSVIPGPIFDWLQQDLDVSAPKITALGAFFMYSYAGTQLVVGILIDHFGGKNIIRWGALLLCIGSLLFPLSHSLPLLYTARILSGVGAGTIYLSLIKETMRFPREWYGMMLGCITSFGFLGGIVSNSPFTAAARHLGGYRLPLLISGIVLFAVYVLWNFSTIGIADMPRKNRSFSFAPVKAVAKRSTNWHIFFFNALNFSLFYVLQTVIGKKFLQDYCGMSDKTSAAVFTITGTLSALAGVVLAAINRMIHDRRDLICKYTGCMAFILFSIVTLLVFFNIRTWWITVIFCIFSTTQSMNSITVPILRLLNSDEHVAIAASLLNFFNFLFVAIAGNLAGWAISLFDATIQNGHKVYGQQSYLVLFAGMLVLSIPEMICALKIPRQPEQSH